MAEEFGGPVCEPRVNGAGALDGSYKISPPRLFSSNKKRRKEEEVFGWDPASRIFHPSALFHDPLPTFHVKKRTKPEKKRWLKRNGKCNDLDLSIRRKIYLSLSPPFFCCFLFNRKIRSSLLRLALTLQRHLAQSHPDALHRFASGRTPPTFTQTAAETKSLLLGHFVFYQNSQD